MSKFSDFSKIDWSKPIETRYGQHATLVDSIDLTAYPSPQKLVKCDHVFTLLVDCYGRDLDDPYDDKPYIRNIPETKSYFVNTYTDGHIGMACTTKNEADTRATRTDDRTGCLKLTYTNGKLTQADILPA